MMDRGLRGIGRRTGAIAIVVVVVFSVDGGADGTDGKGATRERERTGERERKGSSLFIHLSGDGFYGCVTGM